MKVELVISLDRVGMKDIKQVGGKCASLGEMISNLSSLGVAVPNGFAITTDAYMEFIKFNNLEERINNSIMNMELENLDNLRKTGTYIRNLIKNI